MGRNKQPPTTCKQSHEALISRPGLQTLYLPNRVKETSCMSTSSKQRLLEGAILIVIIFKKKKLFSSLLIARLWSTAAAPPLFWRANSENIKGWVPAGGWLGELISRVLSRYNTAATNTPLINHLESAWSARLAGRRAPPSVSPIRRCLFCVLWVFFLPLSFPSSICPCQTDINMAAQGIWSEQRCLDFPSFHLGCLQTAALSVTRRRRVKQSLASTRITDDFRLLTC